MSVARVPVVKIGDVLEGRYRILKTLGEGGMGTVFLAEHALIKRRVALKLLHPELATDADVVERFMNEARAAGTLGHPNIVESTDMGFTAERVPYIVFEFLEGALLTDEIYRVGGFPVRRAVRIAQQIASALHAAHTASIVHRDLKSDNVFLTDKDDALDHVKVLDFGISRFLEREDEHTRRGIVMGTPEFMSPEQITAPDQVDRRTDVYALGVILYEMLTARRPFRSDDDPRALLTRIVSSPVPPLGREDVPHALGELIVNRMLAKDPADRYPSMMDVEAALASYTTQAEAGGLRRGKTPTLPVIAPGAARASELVRRPQLPRPPSTPAPPWHQGRPDTDDHLAAAALPAPIHKKPWLLYGVATAGVVVGALGLVIGTRGGGDERAIAPPPVVIARPPPEPVVVAAAAVPPPVRPPSKIEVRIESDAQDARVTFRRRVTDAPATLQINPSDIVELVEVAAPGYKTERYWLTLDRATHLTARLIKGAGLAEATEEETLIALGELAAPSEPAAPGAVAAAPTASASAAGAAAPAAGAAPAGAAAMAAAGAASSAATSVALAAPSAKPRTVVRLPVRRKIGRAAAPKAPVAMLAPDPVVAAPAALDGDAAPPADPSGSPAAVAGEVAKLAPPDPAKPDPVGEPAKLDAAKPGATDAAKPDATDAAKPGATDAAKPGATDAAKPGAKPDAAKPDGAKPSEPDAATAKALVAAHRADVDRCFAEGRKTNRTLAGTIRLELQVGLDGKIKRVQPHATFDAPTVVDCIVQAAINWTFPERTTGDVITVISPFTFQ